MHKLHSKNLNEENIDDIIEKEKIINERLRFENEKIKEKNRKIQQKLLSFIEDNNFAFESNSTEDVEKYKHVLLSLIEYMNRLKMVDTHMKKETNNLIDDFFQCIKDAIIKQSELCYLIKEDMNEFKVQGKEEIFRKHVLGLRKIYEHNSILRAQISVFNKFKLKDENMIHADFEQLQLKYKNLKVKESCLQKKIENLNQKIRRSTEKKLHYDEKNLYLEKLLEDKQVEVDESQYVIQNKKNLINELKRKKDESIKKYSEVETSITTKNVYDEFHEKKLQLDVLKGKLEEVMHRYRNLHKVHEKK
ncbi:hypothetical protein, conserved [Plasmodium gonderi]|uniref:Uncharacterized protein n=1 Tax=Plasmodium gonderi TaxID=77519 RepID=A0A1Y1JH30_PLAGO|nr:hypothetical protein, conserved [Plasmodium gonderi]GAW79384.1 hypothetical protein, conserved [Plasmodium gonderi]